MSDLNPNEWKKIYLGQSSVYRKCFVAVLDILGFKGLIEEHRDDPSFIADSLRRLIELAKATTGVNLPNRTPKINPIVVSDTLLLFSEKDDFESFTPRVTSKFFSKQKKKAQ